MTGHILKYKQNKTATMWKERLHQIIWSNLQQDLSFGFHNRPRLSSVAPYL